MDPKEAGQVPTPAVAVALFAVTLVLNVVVGIAFMSLELEETWLLVVTPVILIAVTVLAVSYFGFDARETLLLRSPSAADLLMAFPLALSFVVLNDQLSTLTQELYPISEEIQQSWLRMIRAETPADWIFKIATIGVGAAVSEELLFRGFIQGAFLRGMSRTAAVLWTSFLFMALHVLPFPSFAAAGIVLGVAAMSSRSLVVPVAIHFTNNLSALALVNLADLETLGDPVWIPGSILLPALAVFALCATYFLRKLPPAPARKPVVPRRSTDDVASLAAGSSITDALASVPGLRRRLGWLVVGAALAIGVTILTGLFFFTVYAAYPQSVQGRIIEFLGRTCTERLTPEAHHRGRELAVAFDVLASSNENGALAPSQLGKVIVACARVSADQELHDPEVDELLAVIREAAGLTDAPRRL
ncbi:MAG TPA: type II CAAX endopeptidase family protein [Vicinamibacteria bacterium]|nr:type II CAAX endopeptidase family protein [Vicinamibacteria bacterium]